MMPELSLNVLDVAQNSIRAGATLVEISVTASSQMNKMTIVIKDNGCGMSEKQVKNVVDPFFTTRTTRKIGLGVPFFKLAAESAEGSFNISSEEGVGTVVTASFKLRHVDRMPLGDMPETIRMLVVMNTDVDFVYSFIADERSLVMDTREFKEILGDAPLDAPEVSQYIKDFLVENSKEVQDKLFL